MAALEVCPRSREPASQTAARLPEFEVSERSAIRGGTLTDCGSWRSVRVEQLFLSAHSDLLN
jgi:hypothetical protein